MQLPSVSVGPAIERGPLILFPLILDSEARGGAAQYLPGPSAMIDQLIEVTEMGDGAMVSELLVVNRAALPVLLIEGEALIGAKQNRVLNVSVLLAARTTTTIPVSCVERGRWGGEHRTSRSMRHAPGELRKSKTMSVNRAVRASGHKHSDQAQVWREVDGYLSNHAVHSASLALEDVYEQRDHDLQAMLEGLTVAPDQIGMVVGYGGKIRSVDLFDRSESLDAYWEALISGAALDALGAAGAKAPTKASARAFIAQLAAAEPERGAGTGLGTDLRLDTDTLTATALEWNAITRHLAAFAVEPGDRQSAAGRGGSTSDAHDSPAG